MTTRIVFAICLVAIAGDAALGQGREGTVYLPPMENTQSEFQQLASDLTPAENLQQILTEGNAELAKAIESHKQQRTFATKDRVMELMARLSQKVITEIGNLRGNEDRIRDSLSDMIRKVERVQHNLGIRVEELRHLSNKTREQAKVLDGELRNLARKISQKPENEDELRQTFRRKLFEMKRLSRQHKAFSAHLRLHTSFSEQVTRVGSFFENLHANLDELLTGLEAEKNMLVMNVQLLRDSGGMESWLRGEGGTDTGLVAVATKIGELQNALQHFNVATDLIVGLDDVSDLLVSFPEFDSLNGLGEGDDLGSGRRFEDPYIEHYAR